MKEKQAANSELGHELAELVIGEVEGINSISRGLHDTNVRGADVTDHGTLLIENGNGLNLLKSVLTFCQTNMATTMPKSPHMKGEKLERFENALVVAHGDDRRRANLELSDGLLALITTVENGQNR